MIKPASPIMRQYGVNQDGTSNLSRTLFHLARNVISTHTVPLWMIEG
jgi:hypothetical protein